jgi:hypothetical protein
MVDARGREAAVHGMAAIDVSSITANAAAKQLFPRYHAGHAVHNESRDVRTPSSSSFPSGHAASALRWPLFVSAELPVLSHTLFRARNGCGTKPHPRERPLPERRRRRSHPQFGHRFCLLEVTRRLPPSWAARADMQNQAPVSVWRITTRDRTRQLPQTALLLH